MIKIELLKGRDDNCPFWKTPRAENDEEIITWTEKRISVGDANAVGLLGFKYSRGESGLPQYFKKVFELYSRAAELGQAEAHFNLGVMYHKGVYMERDMKKCLHHWEQGAILGHGSSRHDLGVLEYEGGKTIRPMKHLMTAVSEAKMHWTRSVIYSIICNVILIRDF